MSSHRFFKITPKDSVELAKNGNQQKRQSTYNLNLNTHVPSKIRFKEKCRYVEYLDRGIVCNLVNSEGLNIYLEEKEVDLIDSEEHPTCSTSTSTYIEKCGKNTGTPSHRKML
ncbi:hypothetical protein WA026_014054 [Henosepilachna vigintioctopunctata]|uniref:Uncharacterized protein n=1 Tax=Henosepilachna vigintioctopunctata TaxID=420089 RepID=A0AAW1U9S3_9CUCU